MEHVKIIECPRDAMQGLHDFIPTETKTVYLNTLLECGFDTLDFGSFVSPKAIPQMRDTAAVLENLNLNTGTELLAIIANERGAMDAAQFSQIDYLGFPFSISEEFQRRNTNSSIEESFKRVEAIQELCLKTGKKLVVYLSMAFGNPYGEKWDAELVANWSRKLNQELGINILALSDTIGAADPETVSYLFSHLIPELNDVEFGAHLHTRFEHAESMIQAAFDAGCRRFDGAIRGFGGCPMAKDDLTGNMPTEILLDWLSDHQIETGVDPQKFQQAFQQASTVFPM